MECESCLDEGEARCVIVKGRDDLRDDVVDHGFCISCRVPRER